ncbi:hypothetical protein ASD64_06590 [Mesorhizobium sp. Root157]|uniref:hypothetical protein n=1 Tax=Mesorhizobium sp. Root157 TaxID=1736477 RepID=UPI0006FEEB86|nr:hypothetical protein [Mesorhizobium sp. Root157]KQZ87107.1 hypothetical protein ASD64_06590 [Mesorhizobium sp. Root157]
MDLQEETRALRRQLELIRAYVPESAAALAGLYAPGLRPRPEVLLARRVLATMAGLDRRCPERSCRRNGSCQALDVCAPSCAPLWPDDLTGRFFDMAAGIELSALVDEQHRAASHAYVCELLAEAGLQPAPALARGRPGRKSASACRPKTGIGMKTCMKTNT